MDDSIDNFQSRYICSKCLTPPKKSQEVLIGCTHCGNKMFQLKANSDSLQQVQNKKTVNRSDENVELTKVSIISIPKNGVFEIDVEALFEKDDPEPISIVDKKGKIYLNL
jgi:predicted  nucleic acid-binding Zn-ribbon protein